MRRIHPLYIVLFLLLAATVAVSLAAAGTTAPESAARTASVHDDTRGGAAALRRYVSAMGSSTTVIEGDSFKIPSDVTELVILGASEFISPGDAALIKKFVDDGGILVLATDVGLFERSLLEQLGVRTGGILLGGTHALTNAAFADPPARVLAVDRGVALDPVLGRVVLATDGANPIVVAGSSGRGLFYVVGSLAPFLTSNLGVADNGAFALGLVRLTLAGSTIAFDEYHHGFHPSSDVLVLVERTPPGQALAFVTALGLLYLALSGRRLGPPIPLETRPSRSSLEYIRGFAGMVRRSGRGEIARRRLRADLHVGLARQLGVDPGLPFDRVLTTLAVTDPARAAEARAVDDALSRRLRDDQLLRSVRQIERLIAGRTP